MTKTGVIASHLLLETGFLYLLLFKDGERPVKWATTRKEKLLVRHLKQLQSRKKAKKNGRFVSDRLSMRSLQGVCGRLKSGRSYGAETGRGLELELLPSGSHAFPQKLKVK